MKLYATTTSERGKAVSKGGNEYLNMHLQGDKGQDLGMIKLELVNNISGKFYQITYFQVYDEKPDALLVKTIESNPTKQKTGLPWKCMYIHDHTKGDCEFHN
jgi:hypothetical protein